MPRSAFGLIGSPLEPRDLELLGLQ